MEIVLYGRAGCCLCHEGLGVLRRHQTRFGYALREVRIEGDIHLEALYGTEIPVVFVDGRRRFTGRMEEGLFLRLVRGAQRERL